MPIIGGHKVACPPCIRGHRSTKCTHADSRVMVQVRKPGRPLSSCPHQPMRGCSYSVVTAAIPKRQTCHCGTAAAGKLEYAASVSMPSPAGANSDPNLPGVPAKGESENSSATSSPSVTGRPSTSYRVQKAAAKISAHKSSMGLATLDMTDSSHVNILSGPFSNGLSQLKSMAQPPPLVDTTAASFGFGASPAIAQTATGHGYPETLMYQGFSSRFAPLDHSSPHNPAQAQAQAPALASALVPIQTELSANGHAPPGHHSTDNAASPMPNGANGTSSCCSAQNPNKTNDIPRASSAPTQTYQQPSLPPPTPTERKATAGSCCSSKPKEPVMASSDETALSSPVNISPFQQPVSALQDMYEVYYPQPTVFTYPASYGSYLQPLQPEQWRQMMENMTWDPQGPAPEAPAPVAPQHNSQESFNHVSQPMTFGALGSIAPPPNASPQPGIMHECNCGTGCQCLGCAAHPYNDATKEYVRSAWTSMLEDQHRRGSIEGGTLDSHQGISMPTHAQLRHPSTPTNANAPTIAPMDEGSPPAPQTPASDTTSGTGEEQNYPADNFFFVSYPFDSCGGAEESCPCGDDCQCFGCSIHGNNVRPVAMQNEASSSELMAYNINGVMHGLSPEPSLITTSVAPMTTPPPASGAGPGMNETGLGSVMAKQQSCCEG